MPEWLRRLLETMGQPVFSGVDLGPIQFGDEAGPRPFDAVPRGSRPQKLSDEELMALSMQYFGQLGPYMYAIAKAESSGQPGAHNTDGEDSRGLWQINMDAWGDEFAGRDLFDPNQNAVAALTVLEKQGLDAWSAFTGRDYIQYLPQGTPALPSTAGGPMLASEVGGMDAQTALLEQFMNGGASGVMSMDQILGLGVPRDRAMDALLSQFGIQSPTSDPYRAMDAQSNAMNAATAAARQRADQHYQSAQVALATGNLELAQRQFDAGNYWQDVAMKEARFGEGVGAQFSLADTAQGMFGAQSEDVFRRGQLETQAQGNFGNLTNVVGNLAQQQAQLGIDLLTNPRNATAAFLLGRGADAAAAGEFSNFNVQNLLGIDPAQIQNLIQMAVGAGNDALNRARQPQTIDLNDFLTNLSNVAGQSARRGGLEGFGPIEPEEGFARPVSGTIEVDPMSFLGGLGVGAPMEPPIWGGWADDTSLEFNDARAAMNATKGLAQSIFDLFGGMQSQGRSRGGSWADDITGGWAGGGGGGPGMMPAAPGGGGGGGWSSAPQNPRAGSAPAPIQALLDMIGLGG